MPRPPSPGPVTSRFGMRVHPITGERRMHWGQDHGWANGRELVAPESGVLRSFRFGDSAGWVVVIDGDSGASHALAHCAPALSKGAQVGGRVAEGQPVATMSNTGRVTGVHLHWEVTWRGRLIDPQDWLTQFASTNETTPILPTKPSIDIEDEDMPQAVVMDQGTSDSKFSWIAVYLNGRIHEIAPADRGWWDALKDCFNPVLEAKSVNRLQYDTFVSAASPVSNQVYPQAVQVDPQAVADAVDAKLAPRFDGIASADAGDASFTSEDRSILQQIRSFFRA